uniref:Transmembrane protein n=1 Tax=viral metagenome TaxID=1070528 RepID=A0A6C0KXD1_9ZZZZ
MNNKAAGPQGPQDALFGSSGSAAPLPPSLPPTKPVENAATVPVTKIEETEIEETEIEKAIEVELVHFLHALTELHNEFKEIDLPTRVFTILGILIAITTGIISIVYSITLNNDYQKSLLIKNQINKESLDYNISHSISFDPRSLFKKSIKYKFILFLILPVLAFICAVIVIILMGFKPNDRQPIIYIPIAVVLIQSVLSIITNFVGFSSVRKNIRDIQNKTAQFNSYVLLNMYTDPNFLSILQNVPTNSFSMIKAIQAALNNVNDADKNDPTKIASVLLTLNLFIHIQKIGFKNPNIFQAFTLFNPANLTPDLFVMSDYLYRQPTYITNYSSRIIDIYKSGISQGTLNTNSGFATPSSTQLDANAAAQITEVAAQVQSQFSNSLLFSFAEAFDANNNNNTPTNTQNQTPSNQTPSNQIQITNDIFKQAEQPLETIINNLNNMVFKFDPEAGFSKFLRILIIIIVVSLLPTLFLFKNKKFRNASMKYIPKLFQLVSKLHGAPV